MLQKIKDNRFLFFFLKAGILYALLYCFYEFFVKRYTSVDQIFIRFIIQSCTAILSLLGYKTFASPETNDFQVFGIDGSNGVWIGGGCNGITLLFLFAIFVIAYPGNKRAKFWYIPLGLVLIHLINLLRIIGLSLMAYYAPEYLEFNHTYTFTFLAYAFVFGLWMIWVNRYARAEGKKTA